MSINLKEIQTEKIEKVVNILNVFKENVTHNEGIGFVDKSFKIFSPENIEEIIEKVGCDTLINFMTLHSDSFTAKTVADVLKSPSIKNINDQMKIDFIDCHLSNLKQYGKNETYELFFEEEKLKIIQKKPVLDKTSTSLLNLFESDVRKSPYNINVILQETAPIYERNISVEIFISKFKEFFESEKKEILSQHKEVKLSYYGEDFSYDKMLSFVEKIQVSSDEEIVEVLKDIIKLAISGKDQDNVNYIIYLLSTILQKTKEDVKKELLNLFDVSDIMEILVKNKKVLIEFNKDNLIILQYYIDNSKTEQNISELINRMEIIERKDNGVDREAFNFIIKNEKFIDVFVKHGFDKLYNSFLKSLNEYFTYNFGYIDLKEGKDINILNLMPDDNIYRNISLMYNYYKIFKNIEDQMGKRDQEACFKMKKWISLFNDNNHIYLNMFADRFYEFSIDLMTICEEDRKIDLRNIKENDYYIIKEVAHKITENKFTINSSEVRRIVEETLKNDWKLFVENPDGRMYFEILNKLRFLNKETIDVLQDEILADDVKSLFMSKQIVLCLNNSNDYILGLNLPEGKFYKPEFSKEMVISMVNSDSWNEDGYRNMYSLKAELPMNIKIELKEFFNLCYLIEETKNYKRIDIKKFIVEVFKKFVNFDMSKEEFFEHYKEYNNPLFEDIISDYLK